MCIRRTLVIAAAVALMPAAGALAQSTITWGNAAGGSWTTAANWVGGVVPTSNDNAIFSSVAVYNVTLPSNQTITNLTSTGLGRPTFKSAASPAKLLSAATFTVSTDSITTVDNLLIPMFGSATVSVFGDASLLLQNGAVIAAGNLQLGTSGSGVGFLTVKAGSGISTNSTTTTSFLGRNGQTGRIQIDAGGSVDIGGTLAVGESGSAGSNGLIDVVGAGAILQAGTLRLGTGTIAATQGILNVQNGATTTINGTTGTALTIGSVNTGAGELNITGTGTVFNGPATASSIIRNTGSVYILGGTYNMRGATTFDGGKLTVDASTIGGFVIKSGQTLTAQNSAALKVDGVMTFESNANLQVTSSSTYESGGTTINQPGVVANFAGTSAVLGSLDLRPTSGTSSVTFSAGAGNAIPSSLHLGRSSVVGSGTAALTVKGGATLSYGDLQMISGPITTYSASVTVEDAGTVLTQLPSNGNIIGQNTLGGGLATITVRNGGKWQTAATSGFFTQFERNARMVVQTGGIFELRQDMNFRPGSQFTSDAASQFLISNNADVSVFNSTVSIGGDLAYGGGSIFTVATNLVFDVDGTLALGNTVAGTPQFETTGSSTIATLGGLSLASGSVASSPVVRVSGRSTLDASGNVRIGTGNNTGSSALLRVEDSSLFRTTGAGVFELGGGLNLADGLVDVLDGATFQALRTLDFRVGGELQINNASATIGGYTSNGGAIDFQSGTLTVLNNFTTGIGQAIPSLFSVTPAHTLIGGSNLAIASGSYLKLDGGLIKTGTLSGPGQLLWTTGTLEIDLAGTTIGPTAPLGQVLVLDPGKTLKINGTVTVNEVGLLELRGGTLDGPAFGDLVNSGTVLINQSGTAPFAGLITNNSTGIIDVGSLASVSIDANIANAGLLKLEGGIARLSGPGTITNTGVISGDGLINVAVNNTAGIVRLDSGKTLRVTKPFTNGGRVELSGGRIELTNALGNTSTGIITGRGALVSPQLNNSGHIALSSGTSDVYGDVTNSSGGQILISGNSNVTFWDDVTNAAGATLRVSAGSVATFFGTYGGGSISGGGQVFFEADVTPGFSPALINITGNAIFTPTSNLVMELEGPVRGTQYDAIDVAGTLLLQGRLSLEMLGGYVPQHLVGHRILSAGSRLGVFSAVDGIVVDPTHYLAVTYVGNDIFVTATLPGDTNVDGDVDFDDLLVLAQNYNEAGSEIWQSGDFTGNAAVTFDDLLLMAQNYGNQLLSGAQIETLGDTFAADFMLARSIVPEPTLICGLVSVFGAGRRRRV